MSLAAKLPYDHAFAGGFSGIGSQPLPADADALDYLSRMATADGAGVEVGVAVAVDAFVAALKADSLWDAIGSSCLLCGPRTLAGALVPLRGDAPTPDGFASGDYSRTSGLADPNAVAYLDTNRANDADLQEDNHIAAYAAVGEVATPTSYLIGAIQASSPLSATLAGYNMYNRSGSAGGSAASIATGLYATSRNDVGFFSYIRASGSVETAVESSVESAGLSTNTFVFCFTNASGGPQNRTDATIAFYSVGSSLDLAKLDTHITAYVAAIGAAI